MESRQLQELLNQLTIDEKIGQLVQMDGSLFNSGEILTGPAQQLGLPEDIGTRIGSIFNVFGKEKLTQIQRTYLENSRHKIPLLFMGDIINGYKTSFPIPLAISSSFEPELAKRIACASAKEASQQGLHVTFSPMIDLVRDARWGRVMEAYGEDPYLTGEFAKAMVEGYQRNLKDTSTLASCIKHFAGYGAAEGGRDYNTVELSSRTFKDRYCLGYQKAIEAGCKMVMTGFNTLDGIPATANRQLLTDLLREEWGFQGCTISDFASVQELVAHRVAQNHKQAAQLAFHAGCDIDMMTPCYANHLKELVAEKKITMEELDRAVLRVLTLKNELGLFENPYRYHEEIIADVETLAREAVTKSCILMKNHNDILPLSNKTSIALVGPYSECIHLSGMWSLVADDTLTVSVRQGLEEALGHSIESVAAATWLEETEGLASFGALGQDFSEPCHDEQAELAKAIELAQTHDAVVVAIGEHRLHSGEGGSRCELNISASQMKLLEEVRKVNSHVIVLLFAGRPLCVEPIERFCDALLYCWYPGQQGGHGIADLLLGKVSPSARCSMSFPKSSAQYPLYYNHLSTGRGDTDNPAMLRFTCRYLDLGSEPTHPFGYGLTYSQFHYADVRCSANQLKKGETLQVECDITNVGKVEATETVQLYLQDEVSSVARPIWELKGVQRISLKPQQSRTVRFLLDESMLRFTRLDRQFASEPGMFQVRIGNNCHDGNIGKFELIDEPSETTSAII